MQTRGRVDYTQVQVWTAGGKVTGKHVVVNSKTIQDKEGKLRENNFLAGDTRC